MKEERRLEILGILIIALSFFILVSLGGYNPQEEPTISPSVPVENPMGRLGVSIAHIGIKLGFGYPIFILPFLGLVWGWFLFSKRELRLLPRPSFYICGALCLLSISIGLALILGIHPDELNYLLSGLAGGLIAEFFIDFLGTVGTILLVFAGWLMLFRGYFNWNLYTPFEVIDAKWRAWRAEQSLVIKHKEKEDLKRRHTQELISKIDAKKKQDEDNLLPKSEEQVEPDLEKEKDEQVMVAEAAGEGRANIAETVRLPDNGGQEEETIAEDDDEALAVETIPDGSGDNDIHVGEIAAAEEVVIDDLKERRQPERKYQLPITGLLETPLNIADSMSRDELIERANFLTQSLSTFGVEGRVVNVHPGPIITLFEVEPAEGVRVNKFVQLSDDLARVMEASRVRVIAPIPGKSSVGIEIPNRNPEIVYFKSVVNSQEFADARSLLSLAVGKTTSGEIATLDLAKMPHLLIAGTTGSGKSVCINSIICSILYRATPAEVKFVMIDPKKVEMTLYRQLDGYHLLKMEDIPEPIVTTTENAILALRALENEMDRRYNVLADAVVRNIDEYNEKMPAQDEPIMPYIVLVIDELADLMMMSAKDVETPIARLAQLSRAVGIHLVIATQRPSVDVITGVIKANFPSRIAFQVATKIDSRTIIDQSGAEKLIGRGDMLHLGTGTSEAVRMHNAFLSLEEIEAVMNHIGDQPKADEIILPTVREAVLSDYTGENGTTDDLFQEAVALVITHQQGSISLLQRRLKVGYSRAARLVDEMEQAGIVGPFTGSKAREVLVDESYLEIIGD